MTSIERAAAVDASPEAVWAVLADFGGISRWAPNVDHAWALDEPGEGATRRIQAGRLTMLERILTWQPPTTLSYTIEGLPPAVRRVVNEWKLAPSADGGTSVTFTTTVDAGPRPPQRLVARIVGKRIGAASDEMLAGLAEHLAAHGGTT